MHTSTSTISRSTSVSFVPMLDTITPSPEIGGRSGYIPPLLSGFGRWIPTTESDPEARALYRRHLSCRSGANGHRPKPFAGSGERLVLITPQADALIVFRRFNSPDRDYGHGVNCSVFRNEGHFRSCSLIREAVEEWAWKRWPGERLYTYVGGCRVAPTNPGYAFRCAGWRRCRVTIGGVIVLEKTPSAS